MPQNPLHAEINDVAFCYEPVGGAWFDETLGRSTDYERLCLVPIFRYQSFKVTAGCIVSGGLNALLPSKHPSMNSAINAVNKFVLNSDIRVSWAVLWSIHGSRDPVERKLYLLALAALTSAGILSAHDKTGWTVRKNGVEPEIVASTKKLKIQLYFTSEARAAEFNADVNGFAPGKVEPV
jgi:hypothetical protein